MKIIKSKIFKIIVALFAFGFILGIIIYYKIGFNNQIYNYFEDLNNNNYSEKILYLVNYNFKYIILIWISGIVIYLSFLIPILIVFRGILNGYIFICIIHAFHLKGLIIGLILLFPCVLVYEIIYFLISYYSLNFSIKTYNIIKENKMINLRLFIKNYFYQFLIFSCLLLINCFFETFITSNIIRYVL